MLPLKIKPDKYGEAISLLLKKGGGFQTRFQHTLIVDSTQRRMLEQANLVASNGATLKTRNGRGERKK